MAFLKVVEGSYTYNFHIHCLVHFYSTFWSLTRSNRGTLKFFQPADAAPCATSRVVRARAPSLRPAGAAPHPPSAVPRPPRLPNAPAPSRGGTHVGNATESAPPPCPRPWASRRRGTGAARLPATVPAVVRACPCCPLRSLARASPIRPVFPLARSRPSRPSHAVVLHGRAPASSSLQAIRYQAKHAGIVTAPYDTHRASPSPQPGACCATAPPAVAGATGRRCSPLHRPSSPPNNPQTKPQGTLYPPLALPRPSHGEPGRNLARAAPSDRPKGYIAKQ
jgi:hypothetical protein